jgi:hypothetical protein
MIPGYGDLVEIEGIEHLPVEVTCEDADCRQSSKPIQMLESARRIDEPETGERRCRRDCKDGDREHDDRIRISVS